MIKNPLKSNWEVLEDFVSDQRNGVEHPPIQKPLPDGTVVIELPVADPEAHSDIPIGRVIAGRRSTRKFTDSPLKLEELGWLLWATQGVSKVIGDGISTLRSVPSGGARHPFETYLIVNSVNGLDPGLYRYLPLDHALAQVGEAVPTENAKQGCLGQSFAGECAVSFVWTTVPYRTVWRYGPVSDKIIALDAGHICQNLYLACTAMGLGTCAIGAYDQDRMDRLLGVDGRDEFVIYVAPVGRLR